MESFLSTFLIYEKLRKADLAVLYYLDIIKTAIGDPPPAGVARFLRY
jgi:hypothetical protein